MQGQMNLASSQGSELPLVKNIGQHFHITDNRYLEISYLISSVCCEQLLANHFEIIRRSLKLC